MASALPNGLLVDKFASGPLGSGAMASSKNKFQPGRAGIECRFYLVKGYYESTPRKDKDDKPVPMDVLRIGSDNIDDLMQHLKKFESKFDVYSIRLIGMMRLVSGTPYYG
jgi:hypothetical protein